jgi:hypothetical protein
MEERIDIMPTVLGLKPFVLIELTDFDPETEELGVSLMTGGGITREDAPDVLAVVKEYLESHE